MRYKIETTIPTGRQYENLKISYECETLEDKHKAVDEALQDLRKYNGVISKETPEIFYKPKEGEKFWIKKQDAKSVEYTFINGGWKFKEVENG